MRIWLTTPLNVSLGKASTLKPAGCPSLMRQPGVHESGLSPRHLTSSGVIHAPARPSEDAQTGFAPHELPDPLPTLLWRATMPHAEQWARTRVRTSRQVRRGAWYRVLRATALEGVLEVNRRPVTVPRTFLQILPFRPTMWSVVTRLANGQHPPARDRKSTRLNSSHSSISYAVFCLKKKKKH